jgi:hypothetical protein
VFWVEYGFLEEKNHLSRFSSHQLGIIDNTLFIFFQIILGWTTCCPPINLQKKKELRAAQLSLTLLASAQAFCS